MLLSLFATVPLSSIIKAVRFDRYLIPSTTSTCPVGDKVQSRYLVADVCHESTDVPGQIHSFTMGCGGANGVVYKQYASSDCTGSAVQTADFALNECWVAGMGALKVWSHPVVVRECGLPMEAAALTPGSGE